MAEQETLDQALLKGLADVLHEKVLDEAIEKALRHLRGHQDARLDRASRDHEGTVFDRGV